MELKPSQNICQICGGSVIYGDRGWACQHCGTLYQEETVKAEEATLRELLDEQKQEQIANLRQNLYKAVNAEHVSSREVEHYSMEIKKLIPDDFLANFYYVASQPGMKGVAEFLCDIDAEKHVDILAGPIEFLIKSLDLSFLAPLNVLIERAYHNDRKTYHDFATRISIAADDIELGIYDTTFTRDAFIAYSSKDIVLVLELVRYLEEQGIECFVAHRNLRHGSGSVENYNKALKEAMENCHSFVFVSSPNSRNLSCDALKVEMNFIKELDKNNFPPELRNARYDTVDTQYKKPRVEYWIGDSIGNRVTAADRFTKEFFNHYERVYTPENVADRVFAQQVESPSVAAVPAAPLAPEKVVKFCSECGTENENDTLFCKKCGLKEFVPTYAAFIDLKESRIKSQQEALELQRIKAEAEKKRLEEEARRAEERKRKAEEDRKKEEEAIRRAEANKRRLEEEKKKATSTTTYKPSTTSSSSSSSDSDWKWGCGFIIICIIIGICSLIFNSCFDESSSNEDANDGKLTDIILSIDQSEVTVGDTITISASTTPASPTYVVENESGDTEEYNSSKINYYLRNGDNSTHLGSGESITYKFKEVGTYTFYAKYCSHSWSCDPNYDIVSSDTEVVVSPNENDFTEEDIQNMQLNTQYSDMFGDNLYMLNGHYYLLVNTGMNFENAKAYCEARGGHLATVSSKEENMLLTAMIHKGAGNYSNSVYLGGYCEEGEWKWITGEPFDYSHWDPEQPDNSGNYLNLWVDSSPAFSKFDDWTGDANRTFICEWESASDIHNEYGDPDIFKPSSLTTEYAPGLKQDVYVYNGHYYQIIKESKSFKDAQAYCNSIGGHLATVSNADEDALIRSIIYTQLENQKDSLVYIGGYLENNVWKWITGETWSYTNWAYGDPVNSKAYTTISAAHNYHWSDMDSKYYFICEWEEQSAVGDVSYNWPRINSAAELSQLNSSSGNFRLGCDIDLSGIAWTPITGFTGTLNGNGYSIKNMTITKDGNNIGFFDTLSGTVYNLKFENANINLSGRGENVGILCGTCSSLPTNITTSGTVNAPQYSYVGGIAGYMKKSESYTLTDLNNTAKVTGKEYAGGIFGYMIDSASYNQTVKLSSFTNSGAITVSGNYAGGIIGYVNMSNSSSSYAITLTIEKFSNTGAIKGAQYVGGLIGYGYTDSGSSTISYSTNASTVTAEAIVGCIGGKFDNLNLDNCDNKGSTLTVSKYVTESGVNNSYAGGYVGYSLNSIFNNCANTVTVSATGNYVGGIAGYTTEGGTYNMTTLKNTAKITGKEYVGGIFGYMYNDASYNQTVNLSAFTNTGAITGSGNYVGGIIGYVNMSNSSSSYAITMLIEDFANTGAIKGVQYVGGLIGYGYTDSGSSTISYSTNASTVTAEAIVGCIGGKFDDLNLDNCDNKGSTLTVSKYVTENSVNNSYAGGYVGYSLNSIFNNCTNSVVVSASGNYVGGIAGYTTEGGTYNMTTLKNTAKITGKAYVGGIFGYMYNDASYNQTVNLSAFTNTGAITGSGNYVGGIIGYVNMSNSSSSYTITLYINEFSNSGTIKGSQYVGGLLGYGKTDNTNSAITNSTATGSVTGSSDYNKVNGKLENITVK